MGSLSFSYISFLEVINTETVGDNRRKIEARLDQRRHLIPGFKQSGAELGLSELSSG
jgi:hypothetical protein